MTRTLAWVLALAVAGILALLVFVSRSAPEVATPTSESTAGAEAGANEQLVLAGAPAQTAPPPERQPISIQPDQHRNGIADFIEAPVPEQPDGVIEGRVVRAEDGQPIPNAQVELEFAASGFDMVRAGTALGGEPVRPLVARDGSFRCTGLARGTWTVIATSPGRKRLSEPAKADAQTPAAVTLALEMQRDVRVRLVDSSGQLATAESLGVDKWMAGLLNVGVGSACAGAGSKFQHLGDLTYHAKGSGGGFLSWSLEIFGGGPACVHVLRGDTVLSSRELLPGEREVDLLVTQQDLMRDTASCAVRLVDDLHGDPVADVVVKFLPILGAPREVRSDFDGRATAGPLPAGPITIELRTKGYMPVKQVVEIPLREPLVLRLWAGRRVEGIVLDLFGAPMQNIVVVAKTESESRSSQGQLPRHRCVSGADGRFSIDSLGADTYVVQAQPRLAKPPSQPVSDDPTRVAAEPVVNQRVDLRDGDSFAVVLRVNRDSF